MGQARLSFLGAADTVTGSKYLLELDGQRSLIDCGLFQGYKKLRLRNWRAFPVMPDSIDSVILTHAHLDHCGYLPKLVADGFARQVYCTAATRDLCRIILRDSAHLNEQEAERSNRYGYTRHDPAKPLYTVEEAERALELFRPLPFGSVHMVGSWRTEFIHAGHILGAASVRITSGDKRIVFSGDIGRQTSSTLPPPETFDEADVLVIESTYGDRLHEQFFDPMDLLEDIVLRTVNRGGSVVIPAFAVGRTQEILVLLSRLVRDDRLPPIPVYLDSPMAINASDIYEAHPTDHTLGHRGCREAFEVANYVRTAEGSKEITASRYPKIIISASGMASGGRVLHHLKAMVSSPKNTVIFVGFQAGGTRGEKLLAGADQIKIHGNIYDVNAEIIRMDQLSAHADRDELLGWLHGFKRLPKRIFITHGEAAASDSLRLAIKDEFGIEAVIPEHQEVVEI